MGERVREIEKEKSEPLNPKQFYQKNGKNSTDIVIVRRADEIVAAFPSPSVCLQFDGAAKCGTENVYF